MSQPVDQSTLDVIKADVYFMSWLKGYLPTWENENDRLLTSLYSAWQAVKGHPDYEIVPAAFAKLGDEYLEPDTFRWVGIDANGQLENVRSNSRLVRRKKQG